jgi:hypothetical protein
MIAIDTAPISPTSSVILAARGKLEKNDSRVMGARYAER